MACSCDCHKIFLVKNNYLKFVKFIKYVENLKKRRLYKIFHEKYKKFFENLVENIFIFYKKILPIIF